MTYTEQTYGNWQLCLADACEGEETGEFLRKKYKKETRLSYKKVTENNGISGNLNASLKLAMGEYVLFAGQEIIPEPDALFQMVKAITEKKADMIYTDEDEISADGKHYSEPEFKPDFNLFRLRENNYIGQFWAIRKEILEQAGKFDPEYDGAQDYDYILRCAEKLILYIIYLRYYIIGDAMKISTSENPDSKLYAFKAGKKALEDHIKRKKIDAKVEEGPYHGTYHIIYGYSKTTPITIIVVGDRIYDKACVDSIECSSKYVNKNYLFIEKNEQIKEVVKRYTN